MVVALPALVAGCGLAYVFTPPASSSLIGPGAPGGTTPRRFDRVLIVILENQDHENAIKDPELARVASLGASFSDFHGLFHPSYSNYLAMVTGRVLETSHDKQKEFPGSTIADGLEARGFTWKNYAEGYPAAQDRNTGRFTLSAGGCVMDGNIGSRYRRKHVPFLSFLTVLDQPARCSRMAAETEFAADVRANALPNYAFYTPDMINDGHDPVTTPRRGLERSGQWLKTFLEPLLSNEQFMKSQLIIVTYDESKESRTLDHGGLEIAASAHHRLPTGRAPRHEQPGSCRRSW